MIAKYKKHRVIVNAREQRAQKAIHLLELRIRFRVVSTKPMSAMVNTNHEVAKSMKRRALGTCSHLPEKVRDQHCPVRLDTGSITANVLPHIVQASIIHGVQVKHVQRRVIMLPRKLPRIERRPCIIAHHHQRAGDWQTNVHTRARVSCFNHRMR